MSKKAEFVVTDECMRLVNEPGPANRQELAAWCRKVRKFLITERLRSLTGAGVMALICQAACHFKVTNLGNSKLATQIQSPIFSPELQVTEALAALGKAEQWAKAPTEKPDWNKSEKTLKFRGRVVRKIARLGQSKNIVRVLDSFQELHWPRRIDDPLTRDESGHRINETVRSLNEDLKAIRFHVDGLGISWTAKRS